MQNSLGKKLPGTLFVLALFIYQQSSFGQSLSNPIPSSGSDNSPYNQFGIGTLALTPNASLRGMSGIGAGYNDGISMNPENPASYSYLNFTSFSAAFEAKSRTVNYEGKSSSNSFTGNISYLGLVFPIKKFGGFGFGLNPVSNVYYRLSDTINITSSDKASRTYYGDGGLQKGYAGLSGMIKNFSVGINVGYIFGNISTIKNIGTLAVGSIRNYEDYFVTRYGGWTWNAGLMYNRKFKDNKFLNVGVTYNGAATLKGVRNGSSTARTLGYDEEAGTVVINLDTLKSFNDAKGDLILPSSYGLGLHFGEQEHYDINLDIKMSDWSKFRNFGQMDSVRSKTMAFGLGGSFTPNAGALYTQAGSYFSAVTYRAGFYFNQDYVYLRNTDINEIGGSFGMSFPIKRVTGNYQIGKIHAIINAGSRGTVQNGLARELYFNLTIGASLSDLWFIKPVYE